MSLKNPIEFKTRTTILMWAFVAIQSFVESGMYSAMQVDVFLKYFVMIGLSYVMLCNQFGNHSPLRFQHNCNLRKDTGNSHTYEC